MEIKVLGTGCAGCKNLHETVKLAVAELGEPIQVTKVEDMMQIMAFNVMRLPALVIDEKVVASGKKLSVGEVKELIKNS